MRHVPGILLLALMPLSAPAETVAILPVKLLDTSGEIRDQQRDHARRMTILADAMRAELGDSVMIPPEALAACRPQTSECLLDLAAGAGGDRALFVVAQKTSTLILQLFANLVDLGDNRVILSREMNFRGDNDEAWRRAGRFLGRQMRGAGN